ncbi:MAG: hypothetical protein E7454_03400 [Ruminococcaceae bacterium]|nr:hypothetical protein [Oscillospiraceae bacterium]
MKKMSRKILAVVLCAAMLVGHFTVIPQAVTAVDAVDSTSTTPANPNLLDGLNPDFETTNDLKNWTVSDKAAVFQSSTIVTEGKVSLCIKDASADAKQNAISEQTTVIPGDPYYAIAKTFGTTHGVLTVHFYDANGVEMADQAVSQSVAVAKQEWQALSVQVNAPEGAKKAAVEVSTTVEGVGVAYFDNVAFYAEPGDTITLNSSFEGGFDAAECLPEGWRGWGGKTPLRQINTNLNYVHKGKQSMKLDVSINTATNKNTTTGIESNFIDVIPGLPYVYSFWHKSEPFATGNSTSYVYVNFYNVEGERISTSGNPIGTSAYSYSKAFNSVNS